MPRSLRGAGRGAMKLEETSMQRRMIASVGVATVIAAFSITSIAQQPAGQRQGGAGRERRRARQRPFNARELAGVWSRNAGGFWRGHVRRVWRSRLQPRMACLYSGGTSGVRQEHPVLRTRKGQSDAKAHPEEHIGRRRAQPPALGNDP